MRATRNRRAKEILGELAPAIIESFSQSHDPDGTLARFNDFLFNLSRSVNLLAIIAANPDLLELLAEIMGVRAETVQLVEPRTGYA